MISSSTLLAKLSLLLMQSTLLLSNSCGFNSNSRVLAFSTSSFLTSLSTSRLLSTTTSSLAVSSSASTASTVSTVSSSPAATTTSTTTPSNENSLSSSSSLSSSASGWKPTVAASLEDRRKLLRRGIKRDSEKIGSLSFHHVEFYCGDAKSTAQKFIVALGMELVGETGQSTGNDQCVSYALQSGDGLRILLTAPYSRVMASEGAAAATATATAATPPDLQSTAPSPLPGFTPDKAHQFFQKHGFAARAIAVEVKNVEKAFENSVANGATPVLEPTFVENCNGQKQKNDNNNDNTDGCNVAEVELYGDVVLRYISFSSGIRSSSSSSSSSSSTSSAQGESENKSLPPTPFLPHLAPPPATNRKKKFYGLRRIDHVVGNVHNLVEAHDRIKGFTGFHEFAEFTAEDVGTVDSGLNSVVLASDSENVLFPLNEPTEGRRKSQILTYLEQNEGPGIQHLALKTDDIFKTIEYMKQAEEDFLGFELMKRPSDHYYRTLPSRLGDQLSPDQYAKLEELGILADADDEGILLQIFTKPISDRPTFFFEIIQRIGCNIRYEEEKEEEDGEQQQMNLLEQRPGCGGFGQGNFRELFQAIEDHEKTLKV